jgi:trehalose 6-phosphate phosphatase
MIMTKTLLPVAEHQVELDRFMAKIARAQISCLLLDYDGTLAPFSIDRQKALPYPGVTRLLREIMSTGRTRVVMVTGRNALEVAPLLGMHPLPEVWGAHGLQRMRPDGTCETPRLDQGVSQALSDAKKWLTEQKLEQLAEYKPGGIAVHWRGFPEAKATEIRDQVLRGWFQIAQSRFMSVLEFDGGVEIRVPTLDKGDAVRAIVDEMDSATPIAYLGDDTTDERAFKALGPRGLSILVRLEPRRTSAQLWLKPPDDLLDFLQKWLQACRENKTPSADAAGWQR